MLFHKRETERSLAKSKHLYHEKLFYTVDWFISPYLSPGKLHGVKTQWVNSCWGWWTQGSLHRRLTLSGNKKFLFCEKFLIDLNNIFNFFEYYLCQSRTISNNPYCFRDLIKNNNEYLQYLGLCPIQYLSYSLP